MSFQSTLPVRGATPGTEEVCREVAISIHAPREGSDTADALGITENYIFQSTLPVRGATSFLQTFSVQPLFQSTLPVRGATRAVYMTKA